MYKSILVPLALCLFIVASFTGCRRSADLTPVPDPRPGFGFCKLAPGNTSLIVTVRNQGGADAPATTTTVQFSPGGTVSIPTPAIPMGTSLDLPPINFPVGCHDPDCNFRITVDSRNEVRESKEDNNTGDGLCLG